MEIKTRIMRPADLAAVVELEKLIFPDPWSFEAFNDGLDFQHSSGCVAERINASGVGDTGVAADRTAEKPTNIVGYACYYSAGGETHLTNMAVSPELRRKKVAAALMRALFSEAQAQESDSIFLEVRESNDPARRLYESHGFVELYTRKAYYSRPREDAIVYVCELKETNTGLNAES